MNAPGFVPRSIRRSAYRMIGRHWRDWYGSKKPVIGYAFRFLCVIVGLYAISITKMYDTVVNQATFIIAKVAHELIHLLGGGSTLSGATLESGGSAVLTVVPLCTAFDYVWFLIATITAFPARPARKVLGAVVGIAALLILNVLRVSSLFWVGIRFPQHFAIVHEQVWALLLNCSTISLVVAWLVWIKRTG